MIPMSITLPGMTPSNQPQQNPLTDLSGAGLPPHSQPTSQDIVVTERMFTAVSELEANPTDKATIERVCKVAGHTLKAAGFGSEREILSIRFDNFATSVPAGYEMAVALALETLAWYRLRTREGYLDMAVQYIERAAALAPRDGPIARRFSDLVLQLSPEHLTRLASQPEKAAERVCLYQMSAKRALEGILQEHYGVTLAMARGDSPGALNTYLNDRPPADRMCVLSLITNLSELSLEVGLQRKMASLVSVSYRMVLTQLELLGYAGTVNEQLSEILRDVGSSPKPDRFLLSEDLIVDAMHRLSETVGYCDKMIRREEFRGVSKRVKQLLRVVDPDVGVG